MNQQQLPGRGAVVAPPAGQGGMPQLIGMDQALLYHADRCDVETSPWSATLVFAESVPMGKGQSKVQVVVRLSLEQFKVLTMLSRRLLRNHEQKIGAPIPLPAELGFGAEEW